MARVVKQRKPPVVAIVFAFLFFVATFFAVWFGYQLENKNTETLQIRISELEKEKSEQKKKYESEIAFLVELILGEKGSLATVKQEDQKLLYEKVQFAGGGGYIPGIRQYREQLRSTEESKVDEEARRKTALKLKDKAEEEKQELQKTFADNIKAETDKFAEFKAENNKVVEGLEAEKKAENDAFAEKVKSKDQEIAEISSKKNNLETVVDKKEAVIRNKEVEIVKLRDKLNPDLTHVKNPADGKVIKVSQGDICYIDIGSNEGAREGMTFAVIPRKGSGVSDIKGSIQIVDVATTSSTCKILEGSAGSGDKIANLVYSDRQYNFVVIGNFDLTGKGSATPEGRTEIKEAIRTFGGYVEGKVSPQTDFLIVGQRPMDPASSKPRKADEKDPVFVAWSERMKEYKNYSEFQDIASKLNVPVIDTDKFLKLTGYSPKKRAE